MASIINEMASIIEELKKFSNRILELNPPVEEDRIDSFEKKYGLPLPEDYKALIRMHNGFSLQGDVTLGIFNDLTPNSLNAVYEFEHLHNLYPMPKYFIPFSPDGAGNNYCFDVSKLNNKLCPIIFWQRGYEYILDDVPEVTNQSFADWLLNEIVNFNVTHYNYDGTRKK